MFRAARCLILVVGLWLPQVAFSQGSNSWINTSQLYFKIPVAKDGIYQLNYSDLQSSGFPVNSVDPRTIQLFHRGTEQAIYITGQADGIFNSNDYIQFFGQKNDGTLDSSLYRPYSLQPHRYYNLYSDTTAYWLTYTTLTRGIRIDSLNKLVNVSGQPAETYQYTQRLLVLHNQYSAGFTQADEFQATYFDKGEGWTGVAIQQGQSIDYTIDSVFNTVTSAGVPKLEMLLVGRDYPQHNLQILVGPSLRQIAAPSFSGFDTLTVKSDLQWSDVDSNGKILVRVVALSASTNRYQASASYIKITFPQSFNWSGVNNKVFTLEKNANNVSYLSFSSPPSAMNLWDITNPAQAIRVIPATTPFNAVVTSTSVNRRLYSFTSASTPQVIPVSFQDFSNFNSDYLIITNKVLQKPGGGYADPVQAFADYRATAAGGNFSPLIVTVDQLYNQFNYGEVSPLGIYNFISYLAQKNIKYLFLIGKGRDITYSGYARLPVPTTEFNDLVPSAGYPGGDIAYTAYSTGINYYQAIATGRLTASTPDEVGNYLKKVIEIESKPIQTWQKQILHLSGGGSSSTDSFELNLFRYYVDEFASIAEGPYLGGNVTTEAKVNVGIEQINVAPVVNQGVNLVTFFGHSSSETIDIDIGFVDDPTLGYNNPGKYPVFLINGCNAGTIFSNQITFGEDWMLAAGIGSRNFIAGTSFGYAQNLRDYTKRFYEVGFADSTFIKLGIGDIQKESCRRYLDSAGVNFFSINLVQQMVLAGDPALKLYGTALPDYAIDNGSLSLASLDGKPITTLSDSFAVKIIAKNLGAYNPKKMPVRVIRTFNDNSTKTYDSTYAAVAYIDTLLFILRKDKTIDGFGNNLFTVIIDPLNTIKELSNDKANNIATLNAFIPSNGTINLFPTAYGIVNTTSLNLVFQDANLLGAQRNFLVEVDTVSAFNSPFLERNTVSGKVLAKAPINLLAGDSIVYYWRTKPANQTGSDSSYWSVSSFIHISSSPEGWAQAKFDQVANNTLTNLTIDENLHLFNFTQTVKDIQVKSIGENSTTPYTSASLNIGGVEYNINAQQVGVNCRDNTINIVAFNKQTAAPYPGISVYLNDARGCGLQPSVINSFLSTELEASDGINLINAIDGISESDSVVMYAVGNPAFSTWSSNVLNKLTELGISNSQITSLQDGEPVVILAKKGSAVGSANVMLPSQTPITSQDLAADFTITGKYTSGNVTSVVIGPAKKWISFSSRTKKIDTTNAFVYSIYGLSLNGEATLLNSNVPQQFDLSSIDASIYPQLKLQFNVRDSVNQTAAQIRNWFVLYESVAEGLLFFDGSTETQTVQEGETYHGQYGFVNISSQTFTDSLQVSLDVKNISKSALFNQTFKINAPPPGDTTKFSIAVDTRGKAGLNDLTVFVNPKIQPEQYYENNVIGLDEYLNVLADRTPPLLEVTVDGRYLQNGDYVSNSPVILATLHDDNPFLYINDTTHLNLFLSYPCDSSSCAYKRINFSRADVQWAPANSSTDFMFKFHPQNLLPGTYVLQVNANDESGNSSGVQPYQVSFQVKDETTISLNSVYPNPSKDIFNFNFELSGNELPDDFSLKIFSSEGQLLNQFGMKDVGGFIIGTNNLTWNASQAQLSNGLLVYRMTVTANGKTSTQSGRLILVK